MTRTLQSLLAMIATALILLAAVWTGQSNQDAKTKNDTIAFFLIGDTHLLANKKEPSKLDERSASLAKGLVNALNKLPGTNIPRIAGGGTVLPPLGVIHA